MNFAARSLLLLPAVALAAPALPGASGGTAEASQARSRAAGLCAAGETILFQCRSGLKTIAVCGSRTPTPHAQYRYGRPGNIELVSPPGSLSWARVPYSGGGELQIRFHNGGHDYAVYSRTIRTRFSPDGRNEPAFEDGVEVLRNGRTILDRRCAGEARSDGQAEDYMPEGTFLERSD